MTEAAYAILQEAGVIPHRHRSRPLTAELCRRADAIYCDIPEPSATSLDDQRHTAMLIQQAVQQRLARQFL
jgi:protein-tyrosine-phosphatase